MLSVRLSRSSGGTGGGSPGERGTEGVREAGEERAGGGSSERWRSERHRGNCVIVRQSNVGVIILQSREYYYCVLKGQFHGSPKQRKSGENFTLARARQVFPKFLTFHNCYRNYPNLCSHWQTFLKLKLTFPRNCLIRTRTVRLLLALNGDITSTVNDKMTRQFEVLRTQQSVTTRRESLAASCLVCCELLLYKKPVVN